MAYRGLLETTPYSDWLFAQTMLFIIDIGYSGGRRSYSEYRLSEWNNFADVVFEGKDIGLPPRAAPWARASTLAELDCRSVCEP